MENTNERQKEVIRGIISDSGMVKGMPHSEITSDARYETSEEEADQLDLATLAAEVPLIEGFNRTKLKELNGAMSALATPELGGVIEFRNLESLEPRALGAVNLFIWALQTKFRINVITPGYVGAGLHDHEPQPIENRDRELAFEVTRRGNRTFLTESDSKEPYQIRKLPRLLSEDALTIVQRMKYGQSHAFVQDSRDRIRVVTVDDHQSYWKVGVICPSLDPLYFDAISSACQFVGIDALFLSELSLYQNMAATLSYSLPGGRSLTRIDFKASDRNTYLTLAVEAFLRQIKSHENDDSSASRFEIVT